MTTASQLVGQYSLQPHPEGGWYKETYKSNWQIPAAALPGNFGGDRPLSTAIYFLLQQNEFSAFHRIRSDECWHFYAGGPLTVYVLHAHGELELVELGNDITKGQVFQYVVPANTWFASKPSPGTEFSFVGCTVAPGFDFADFEMAGREELSRSYPVHATVITSLTRV